ncbi:MAG: hypothetical protein ACKPKO_63410, partial [Candidatus Fonsibacter sp.]
SLYANKIHSVIPSNDDGSSWGPEGDIEPPPGDVLPDDDAPTTRRSLQEAANSLFNLLTHSPNNPYCDSCRRAKMKESQYGLFGLCVSK